MTHRRFAHAQPRALCAASLLLAGSVAWRASSAPPQKFVPVSPAPKAIPKATPKSLAKPLEKSLAKPLAKPLAQADLWSRDVLPFVDKYCASCHIAKSKGGVSLKIFRTPDAVFKDAALWERVAQNVGEGTMPPPDSPQPGVQQRRDFVAWSESALSTARCKMPDPGRVTLRRLNKAEYDATIRDLFGIDFHPAADFPSDDVGEGFDNIGDVLSISPLLMEKYLNAAEQISEKAISTPRRAKKHYETDQLNGGEPSDGAKYLSSTGEIYAEHNFTQDGTYLVRVQAWAMQAGPEVAKLKLKVGDKEVKVFDVPATAENPQVCEEKLTVPAGKAHVSAAFINDFYDEKLPVDKRDRNLAVDWIEVVGPLDAPRELPPSQKQIIFREPPPDATPQQQTEVAREIVTRLARRAWRRPATPGEIDRLMRAVEMAQKDKEPFERGIQLAMQAILVSPNFLFRVELDAEPNNPKASRFLTDYELATRLSYFLWSSTPDEKLDWWSDKGALSKPQNLLHQTHVMLKDARAQAITDNFAAQWLHLRMLDQLSPDPDTFPVFNDDLRAAMKAETLAFFQNVVREDRSILEFLDADYSFLNEPLARLYGVPNISGPQLRRVTFSGEAAKRRGGLVTQASILTLTSNPTRTSPVKRGKWVLEQFWNAPPPPPPPGVPDLPGATVNPNLSLRQKLEQHRKNPACASCHARMDGIGFSLENYDATGAWRTRDGKFAVDTSGVLADGTKFSGPVQLKTILKARKDVFARCFTEKLLTYAIGRGLTAADKCAVDAIVQQAQKNNYRFSSLIDAIVISEPFRKKRGDDLQSGK